MSSKQKAPDYLSFVEYQNDIVCLADGVHESGNWRVDKTRVPSFIGKAILFHKNQSAGAHLGGIITGAYQIESGHTVFRFQPDPKLIGTVCGGKWGRAQALCYWNGQ